MKVAVSANNASLDATVDARFGRCAQFVLVDTTDMSYVAVSNAANAQGGGAGIQSAQLLAHEGIDVVLTGNCGPNAHQTLADAGIQVVLGCSGTVQEAVERFKSGQLQAATGPNVTKHSGTFSG